MQIAAHAKLNLCLAVGPPQPPKGYHPICSWFVPVRLADTVHIERGAEGRESVYEVNWAPDAPRPSPIDWPIDKDLAVRAHRLLQRHAARPLPVRLRVEKRIPVGGGLGGGSSDAAAVLRGADDLFGLSLDEAALHALGMELGSDVAFFLDAGAGAGPPRAAVVSGFGESITRVAHVPGRVLLIFPPFGCPTGPVYQAFDRGWTEAASTDPQRVDEVVALAIDEQRIPGEGLFNDLFAPACAVEPRLGPLVASLRDAAADAGVTVMMTGSGSTLFAIAKSDVDPDLFRKAAPGCALVPASLV